MKERHEHRPRIFSIAPGAPFLRVLARALAEGRLIPGLDGRADPMTLAQATVYLPTRRAARAFAGELVEAVGRRATILPAIRTLGDGEDEEFAAAGEPETAEETSSLPPAVGELERLLELAFLVQRWTSTMSDALRRQLGDDSFRVPATAGGAIALARELAALLDRMETEEIGWERVGEIVGEDLAQWFSITADFLKILTEHWPQHREASGRIDPARRRSLLLGLRARRIAAGRTGPVVIAGTTGSIPATRRLIAAALGRDDCAVVLPGVDFELPQDAWDRLATPHGEEAAALAQTHPQAALAHLLAEIGVARGLIGSLGPPPGPRARLVADALLPAALTAQWAAESARSENTCAGIAVVEAPAEREEAVAIAIALREAAETPGRTAALVTPDRNLARRVSSELARFGIAADDSAGLPLAATAAGRLALQAATLLAGGGDRAMLAAVLKHPAIAGGEADAAHTLEVALLRSDRPTPPAGGLAAALAAARTKPDPHAHPAVRALSETDWRAAVAYAQRIDAALGGGRLDAATLDIRRAAAVLGDVLRELAGGRIDALEGGGALGGLLTELPGSGETGGRGFLPTTRPAEFPAALAALMATVTVREARPAHPRLAILGPLEARLQHFDLAILGGLNEGVWPPSARNDPFLNRPMRGALGMSMPERRIGQAAHDFVEACSMPEAILTRPAKAGGAPTVASRFLQRLQAAAGGPASQGMARRGGRLLSLARMLDRPDGDPPQRRAKAPCPTPPPELRPQGLSITEIETLIRDPYAIYARHVLGLRPMPPLEPRFGPAQRGTIFHAVLAEFVAARQRGETPAQAQARFDDTLRRQFAAAGLPDDVRADWLPRFGEIGRLFLAWDEPRLGEIAASHCEVSGKCRVGSGDFELRGRADRIDTLANGTLVILDYKTGASPSKKQVSRFSPQLLLEAAMAARGAFGEGLAGDVAQAAHLRLRREEKLKDDWVEGDLRSLAAEAWGKLERLVAAFGNPAQGYASRRAVEKEGEVTGDYDHLARVREWSVLAAEDGGDD